MLKWVTVSWWRYLLETPGGSYSFHYSGKYWLDPIITLFCRIRGHAGPIWYSSGLDPNMHCKRCGDFIG